MLSKMKFFRNSIRNAPYSAPNFTEFHCEGFGLKKCEILQLTFEVFFFIKTKKMIFLEVTMTTIGKNTSTKCLQCIKYDNS